MTALSSPASRSARWERIADRLFLWVPNAGKPGVGAFLIGLVRQCTLPFVLMALILILLAPVSRQLAPPNPIGVAIGLGSFVVFEELARYAFVRRAEKRVRAMVIFTLATIAVECVTYFNPHLSLVHNLIRRAPSWGVHAAAGAVLYWALADRQPADRHPADRQPADRRRIIATVAALIGVHTAFDVATVQLFGAQMQAEDAHAAPAHGRSSRAEPIVRKAG